MTLTEVSTGETKWDGIYDLGGSPILRTFARPLGGEKPFFAPDWCGASTGLSPTSKSKSWVLKVQNLDGERHALVKRVGALGFTQFPPELVEQNYRHEQDIGLVQLGSTQRF